MMVNDTFIPYKGIEFTVILRNYMYKDRVLVVRDLNNSLKFTLFSPKPLEPDAAIGYINKFLLKINEYNEEQDNKWKNTQMSLEDSSPS